MNGFPLFMRNPKNAVKKEHQSSITGIEGYIFDGVDGSQMIIWQIPEGGNSDYHTHDFDEYFVVIEGSFEGDIGGSKIILGKGDECFIKRGTPHNGQYSKNFRAIYAFSERRADRNK